MEEPTEEAGEKTPEQVEEMPKQMEADGDKKLDQWEKQQKKMWKEPRTSRRNAEKRRNS
ncbi:hypothetical protein ACT7C5_19405 [Bacillus pacificus]